MHNITQLFGCVLWDQVSHEHNSEVPQYGEQSAV